MRRWFPGLFPVSPTQMGTPPQFHLALGDLNDAQVRQVIEEVQQKTARREGQDLHWGHIWAGGESLHEELMLT